MRIQKAFVLVKAETGHEKEVADQLSRYAEVKEVHIISGEWDIIAVLETQRDIVIPSDEKVMNIVLEKILKTRHVRDTNTLIPHFSKYKS